MSQVKSLCQILYLLSEIIQLQQNRFRIFSDVFKTKKIILENKYAQLSEGMKLLRASPFCWIISDGLKNICSIYIQTIHRIRYLL